MKEKILNAIGWSAASLAMGAMGAAVMLAPLYIIG